MLDKPTMEQFTLALRGQLIQLDDADYDKVRAVWNGMIERRPSMIAQCTGAADVMTAVNFARENNLPFTVRAGGHSVAGKSVCDDGLVIDLSPMNSVQVDPDAKKARVGAGATWRDFDHEAQAFGLATTGGTDPRTGVAGLTLGGGLGFLARKYGLATDNLLSVDVVLANGELVRASERENPELFWALRGGGGNFGVVTSFEFQLHEVGPEVMVAQLFHPFENAREVLQFYRDFNAGAPDEVACYALFAHVPPAPPFPEELHGKTTIAVVACYWGDVAEGNTLLEPLHSFGDPILKVVQPMPYVVLQKSFEAGTPDGQRYYWKSQYLQELSDEAIDTIVSRIETLPGAFTVGGFEPMGGAINRVDPAVTAYPHRNAAYNFSIFAGWSDPEDDEETIAWTREFHRSMTPYSTGGVYVNYLDKDDQDRTKAAYGDNYERLLKVKATYDPDNLFRVNQNLKPASTSGEPTTIAS